MFAARAESMTPYNVDSYDLAGPKPAASNYFVRSNLPRGKMHLCSGNVSAKLLLTGCEVYQAENKRYPVTKGQFLLTAPEERLKLTIDSFASGCCFYFDVPYLYRMISESLSDDLEGGGDQDLTITTMRLPVSSCTAGASMLAVANNLVDADVHILTAHLARCIVRLSHLGKKLPLKRKTTRKELLARLECARAFILDAQDEIISLADIEKASCLSRFHLSRSFALVYGMPPLRFHQHIRMDAARAKIRLGVAQKVIAETLGFSTESSFCRAYLRHHKHSPSLDRTIDK